MIGALRGSLACRWLCVSPSRWPSTRELCSPQAWSCSSQQQGLTYMPWVGQDRGSGSQPSLLPLAQNEAHRGLRRKRGAAWGIKAALGLNASEWPALLLSGGATPPGLGRKVQERLVVLAPIDPRGLGLSVAAEVRGLVQVCAPCAPVELKRVLCTAGPDL